MEITRFAPSPTGYLHLGHAYCAKFASDIARQSKGLFLLRIEDIDQARCRPQYIESIYEDLDFLEIKWDNTPLVQSTRMNIYANALEILKDKGFLYPCICTRQEISQIANAPHAGQNVIYPKTCLNKNINLVQTDRYCLRLNTKKVAETCCSPLYFNDARYGKVKVQTDILGDVALARKEMLTSYHLSSVIDDAFEGITCVTRGEDLLDSTHIHRCLQFLLQLPTPSYVHHRLLLNPDGSKFSKRTQSITIKEMREKGLKPKDIFDFIAYLKKD